MAYFADLTAYGYILSRFTIQPDAVNVGWLDIREPITKGDVPIGVRPRLQALIAHPVNLCRGSHRCWCGRAQGNGEIRVTAIDGTVFAAPVLIAHYIDEHGYRPPQAFIDAVMRLPATATIDPSSEQVTK